MREAQVVVVNTPSTLYPKAVRHRGRSVSLSSIFKKGGIFLDVRRRKVDPKKATATFDLAQLHRLMRTVPKSGNKWSATVLIVPWIQVYDNGIPLRLRGVMFDAGGGNLEGPEREGCAVSYQSVAGSAKGFLRTVAHELGHVFNLTHTGRRGTTIMYPTKAVVAAGDFPSNIDFSFENKDANWLRSGDAEWVRPGGRPFRGGGPSPDAERRTLDGVILKISTRWEEYRPGEPLRLRYALRNNRQDSVSVAGLPTTSSQQAWVCARSQGYDRYELRPPYYYCDNRGPVIVKPGGRLLWGEYLSPDPRLDALGEHSIEARVAVCFEGREHVVEGSTQVKRSLARSVDSELTRQVMRPWFRRAVAHGSVCHSTGEEDAAISLLREFGDVRELDALRLCVATGIFAAGEDPMETLGTVKLERLDLEQKLQLAMLQRGSSVTMIAASLIRSIASELGYPSEWTE